MSGMGRARKAGDQAQIERKLEEVRNNNSQISI